MDIPDSTHLVLASPVATAVGQKVANGTVVSLVCGSANPTPYAEWPDPATQSVTLNLTPGAPTRGGLTLRPSAAATETLTDDSSIAGITSANAASSNVRLIYQTAPLAQPVRISGTPLASLGMAFGKSRANLTAALVSYPPTGNGVILTRGWLDPANRNNDWTDIPVRPGTFYRLDVDMQPKDTIVPAGNRLALMVISSDRDFTIRPAPARSSPSTSPQFALAPGRRRLGRARRRRPLTYANRGEGRRDGPSPATPPPSPRVAGYRCEEVFANAADASRSAKSNASASQSSRPSSKACSNASSPVPLAHRTGSAPPNLLRPVRLHVRPPCARPSRRPAFGPLLSGGRS